VVAGAAGTVRNVRDGMRDVAVTDEASRKRIAGRECGNGVVIDHEGDWETQYCHLRQGSIKVKAGDRVERGNQLGLVGLSGKTEFPHVHLTVRKDGNAIDPFTNRQMIAGCGKDGKPLWRAEQPIDYEPVALYNVGFATDEPDIEAVRSGKRDDGPFPATAPALVLWADIFGVEMGDRLLFRIVKATARWCSIVGSRSNGPRHDDSPSPATAEDRRLASRDLPRAGDVDAHGGRQRTETRGHSVGGDSLNEVAENRTMKAQRQPMTTDLIGQHNLADEKPNTFGESIIDGGIVGTLRVPSWREGRSWERE